MQVEGRKEFFPGLALLGTDRDKATCTNSKITSTHGFKPNSKSQHSSWRVRFGDFWCLGTTQQLMEERKSSLERVKPSERNPRCALDSSVLTITFLPLLCPGHSLT